MALNIDKKQNDADKVASTTTSYATNCCNRLGTCEVCAAQAARYVCPKCELRTCCVQCVQIHKRELDCNGVRDRTKFIPLRKMTARDFMSDYYFLEECTRYTADRKRDRIKRYTQYKKELPERLLRLRNEASKRGTRLRILLENFTRHKRNTTFYDWKQRRLYWRIEWIFVNALNCVNDDSSADSKAQSLRYVDARCDEDKTLAQLLAKYIEPKHVDAASHKALAYYQSAGMNGIQILLRAECVKRSGKRFYRLDACKTLRENLARKIIVEYPSIYVSYEPQQASNYDIIDSDVDIEQETKAYAATLSALAQSQNIAGTETAQNLKKQARASSRKCATKRAKPNNNLLFSNEQQIDDLSSDDDEVVDAQISKNSNNEMNLLFSTCQILNTDAHEDYFSDDNEIILNMDIDVKANQISDSADDGVSVDDSDSDKECQKQATEQVEIDETSSDV